MKKLSNIIYILLIFAFSAKKAFASGVYDNISTTTCLEKGNCQLNDMVQVGVNISNILLALSGSVALLFFVYGGVTFLISGGSPEKVSKGKQIISNSVIGLLIIFSSYLIISYLMSSLGYSGGGIFGTWNQSK